MLNLFNLKMSLSALKQWFDLENLGVYMMIYVLETPCPQTHRMSKRDQFYQTKWVSCEIHGVDDMEGDSSHVQ